MNLSSGNNNPDQPLIISYLSLRKFVGILGAALPFISVAGTFIFSDCRIILSSVSQYYYSIMGNFFVGSLCAIAVFLFSYNGYDIWDRILSVAAGIFAVVSAFFPTHLSKLFISCDVNLRDSSNLSNTIHIVSSALFFITLATTSIFMFTKSKGLKTPRKIIRNKIYRVCGYTMLSALLLMGVYQLPSIHIYFEKDKPIIFLEALALVAFGISWLIKGEFLLKDE